MKFYRVTNEQAGLDFGTVEDIPTADLEAMLAKARAGLGRITEAGETREAFIEQCEIVLLARSMGL